MSKASRYYQSPDGRVSAERVSLYMVPPHDRKPAAAPQGAGGHYILRTLGSVTDVIPERAGQDFDSVCAELGLLPVPHIPKSRQAWRAWAQAVVNRDR